MATIFKESVLLFILSFAHTLVPKDLFNCFRTTIFGFEAKLDSNATFPLFVALKKSNKPNTQSVLFVIVASSELVGITDYAHAMQSQLKRSGVQAGRIFLRHTS